MKTFESCDRVWLTMPEDGKMPLGLDFCRALTHYENKGLDQYTDDVLLARHVSWGYWAGWYPVHADGTDDHETAKRFITDDEWKARLPRLREGAEWCCKGTTPPMGFRPRVVGELVYNKPIQKDEQAFSSAPVPPEFLHHDELAKQHEAAQAPDFGEPWQPSCEMIFDRDGDYVAEFQPPFHDSSKVAARAIACVNALAGVPDPAEFVRQAMEMKEAIGLAHCSLNQTRNRLNIWFNASGAKCQTADAEALVNAESALSKLQPFLP